MLEKSFAEWRQEMRGRLSDETIAELESHWRDAVAGFVQSGMTEEQAFERAAKELGSTSGLAREFEKTDRGVWLPVKLAIGVGFFGAAAGVITLLLNLDNPPLRFLLWSHVVLVTLGYSTTFLIGALGICYVGQRSFSGFPRRRLRTITRATFALGCAAAIATIGAVLLGSIWTNVAWGRYWAWDMKEVGGLAVILWQVMFVAAHWFLRRNEQVLVLLSILGNVPVGMAWFASSLVSGIQAYGTPVLVCLVIAVAANCALLVAGFAPAGWLRRFKVG